MTTQSQTNAQGQATTGTDNVEFDLISLVYHALEAADVYHMLLWVV